MLNIVLAVVAVLVALLAAFLYKWQAGLAKFKHIPGPKNNTLKSFFLGNLNEVLDRSDGRSMPEKMIEW
jgi:hypothetical protein